MENSTSEASKPDSVSQSGSDEPPQSNDPQAKTGSLQDEINRIESRIEFSIRKYSAAEIAIIGFAMAILIGSILLFFIENRGENVISYVDALFISTSAICVTGLTSVDFSKFTFAGQVITMVLIQVGGFGVVTAFRLLWIGRTGNLSPGTAQTLGSVMDVEGEHRTIFQVLASTAKITLAIEGVGCLLLYLATKDRLAEGPITPLWFSVFHTISAFNNAGFGLYTDNLMPFRSDVSVNMIIAGLIVLGGIGYPVLLGIESFFLLMLHKMLNFSEALMEMIAMRRPDKLYLVEPFYNFVDRLYLRSKKLREELAGVASPLQMKIVIWGTVFLLAIGTVLMAAYEWDDPHTLGQYDAGEKWLISFFHSVATRTAGFNTVDIGLLQIRTLMVFISLMFIGAAPQGTAGGIKIPTFATMLGYIRSSFRGMNRVSLFRYVVSKGSVGNAVKLYVLSSTFVLSVILLMTVLETRFTLTQMAFEVVSAFGTVGLTAGITMLMTPASKILIVVTMFVGRVGLLTIGSAIIKPTDSSPNTGTWTDDGMKLQIG